jgi:hypothetical protein
MMEPIPGLKAKRTLWRQSIDLYGLAIVRLACIIVPASGIALRSAAAAAGGCFGAVSRALPRIVV